MQIVAISDTHTFHDRLIIPSCDVLVHAGDIGKRTNLQELNSFLQWFSDQPSKVKIFIAGNHDIVLDFDNVKRQKKIGFTEGLLANQYYYDAIALIKSYINIHYLNNTEYIYNGVKFWGSPYSPSFNRQNWVFNADRGEEIQKVWGKIPNDVNVLITHTPPYNIQDWVGDEHRENINEDLHVGCKDLFNVIKKRLFDLQLHVFGHIHSGPYGCTLQQISHTRSALFCNAAVLNNQYKQQILHPLIITI